MMSVIFYLFMNKIHTFHVTFHDIEGQSSEGLINLEGSFPDVYPPERNKSQVNKEFGLSFI